MHLNHYQVLDLSDGFALLALTMGAAGTTE
jgi:hypothetical protein